MEKNSKSRLDDEILYRWGTAELTLHHQRKYVEKFKGVPGKVLEIGCGNGVILELFRREGISAYGLDRSETAVESCRSKNLEAVAGDALSHLRSLSSESLGGIFCAHVIEHLEPREALELISETYRTLKRGGKIVFITPNAKDLRTTERFWLDLTHVRPYPRKLMQFLLSRQGFSNIRISNDDEPTKNVGEKIAKKILHIWFMGYLFTGDLVVIAER